MAIRKIARMGHPILRQKALPVSDPAASETRAVIRDMLETVIDAQGAGIAGPQVYESRRIVLFQLPGEEGAPELHGFSVLINPEIEMLGDDMEEDWEGCLSVPGLRGIVPRYSRIRYSGIDLEGRLVEREAEGFHARVVQHECDHLDGVLYPQRMVDLSKLVFESEWRHWVDSRQAPADAD
jgi:peptide deformylase